MGNNGGGFINSGRGDDAGALAELRGMLGEEQYQLVRRRLERTRELLRDPQPLTPADAEVLRAAVAPLLRDVAATGLTVPGIRAEAHEDREWAVCGWIAEPGGYGQGIWIMRDRSPAEQVAELAEQFQQWASDQLADSGRPPAWPPCRAHDLDHGVGADVQDGSAVWVCGDSGTVISLIGSLPT